MDNTQTDRWNNIHALSDQVAAICGETPPLTALATACALLDGDAPRYVDATNLGDDRSGWRIVAITDTAVIDVEARSTHAAWSYETPGPGNEHLLGPTVKARLTPLTRVTGVTVSDEPATWLPDESEVTAPVPPIRLLIDGTDEVRVPLHHRPRPSGAYAEAVGTVLGLLHAALHSGSR